MSQLKYFLPDDRHFKSCSLQGFEEIKMAKTMKT